MSFIGGVRNVNYKGRKSLVVQVDALPSIASALKFLSGIGYFKSKSYFI